MFDDLATVMENAGKSGRKFAVAARAIAIAEAVISAHLAAAKSLAEFPWPFNLIAAGVSYAAGAARVAAISSTKIPSAQTGGEFTIPDTPATRNDGARLAVQGGEQVSVTPRGESSGKTTEVNIQIGEYQLFKVIQKGQVRLEDIVNPMGKLTGMAGAMGIKFDTVTLAVGELTKTLPAREAITALSNAFSKLSLDPRFADTIRGEGGLIKAIETLNLLTPEMQKNILGDARAMRALNGITVVLSDAIKSQGYFVADTSDLMKEFGDKTKSAEFRMRVLDEELKNNFRTVGKTVIPVISALKFLMIGLTEQIPRITLLLMAMTVVIVNKVVSIAIACCGGVFR
jgi:hypothetical protein